MTANELDGLIHRFIIDQKAYPSTLGYHGYPKSICVSGIDDIVVHGIPSDDLVFVEGLLSAAHGIR